MMMMNSNLSLFVWNYQGCANSKFPCIFKEYNLDFKLNIVSLLGTKISGRKADEIIAELGFQFSHRVEAKGFSGGIWIGWKNIVRVDIIQNYPQFVLAKIHNGSFM